LNYLKRINQKYLHINIQFGYYYDDLCSDSAYYILGIKKIYYDKHVHEYKYKNTNEIIDLYDLSRIYEDYIIKMIRNIYKINFNNIKCRGSKH